MSTSSSQSLSQFQKRSLVKEKKARRSNNSHLPKKRKRRNLFSRLRTRSGLSLTESLRTYLSCSSRARELPLDMM